MSKTIYITVLNNFILPKITVLQRNQFIYKGYIDCFPEYEGNNGELERHYIGELCEVDWYEEGGETIKEIYIPEKFSVLDTVCIPTSEINIPDYIYDRDSGDIKDYYAFVKDQMGIDMTLNHKIQRNPEKYDPDLFPINKIKKSNYPDES